MGRRRSRGLREADGRSELVTDLDRTVHVRDAEVIRRLRVLHRVALGLGGCYDVAALACEPYGPGRGVSDEDAQGVWAGAGDGEVAAAPEAGVAPGSVDLSLVDEGGVGGPEGAVFGCVGRALRGGEGEHPEDERDPWGVGLWPP